MTFAKFDSTKICALSCRGEVKLVRVAEERRLIPLSSPRSKCREEPSNDRYPPRAYCGSPLKPCEPAVFA